MATKRNFERKIPDTIGGMISYLYRSNQRWIQNRLEDDPLQAGATHFIHVIGKNPGISQEGLSRLLLIDKAVIARVLKKLEGSGLVERRTGDDRRKKELYLTAAGEEIIPRLEEVRSRRMEIILQELDQGEREMMRGLLKKMAASALREDYSEEI